MATIMSVLIPSHANVSRILCNGKQLSLISSKFLNSTNGNQQIKMNNYSDYYSNYSNLDTNTQYYNDQTTNYTELGDLSENYDLNFDLNSSKPINLNNLPVNYYHVNYSDLLNNNYTISPNSSINSIQNNLNFNNHQFNQTSRRLFHRHSIICSSMKDKYSTLNGENITPLKRSIDQIEELIANKTLFHADLTAALSASPSICSNWNSSEKNMIGNNSNFDDQSLSLYNSTLSPNPSNKSRHSIAKRSSIISSDEKNQAPRLKPIFVDGKFQNPYPGTWKEKTFFGLIKFLLSSSPSIPSKKDLDITLPVVKPIINSTVPEDKIRAIWIGHATTLIQFENATILTDPHFSPYAHPLKISVKRFRPPPISIDELPDSLNVVCISHNHYDHLDLDSVVKLDKRFKKQLNWFVPLGMKKWFNQLEIENVIELNWWEEHLISELDDLKIVSTPAQHWSRRGLFDENKELWSSYSIIGKKFRYFFAGDTGYNEMLFKAIGQAYGPFNLAAIPIGAYEPSEFLKSQHVNPKEAVLIHKNVKSKLSMSIHWGTFQLSNEGVLDPPIKLREACEEEGLGKDKFLSFEHGETRLISIDGDSKRENVNRYAK